MISARRSPDLQHSASVTDCSVASTRPDLQALFIDRCQLEQSHASRAIWSVRIADLGTAQGGTEDMEQMTEAIVLSSLIGHCVLITM
jgi:hypothetical protein